jgi:hypothetical protein
MSTRFITNTAVVLGSGFLVVASQAFTPSVTAWLALAVAIGILGISAAAQLDASRGIAQRALDGAVGALAVVTIVFSLVFTGNTVMWLSFAEALGFVALAFTGLTINEAAQWRAEHGLAPLHGLRVVHRSEERKLAA